MGRRKNEGGGIPEWMCTFGDMMSLLLCFFIMLYSMSIIAEVRWQAVADTLTSDFGYQGSANQKAKNTKTTTTVSDSSARSRRTAALVGGQPTPAPQSDSKRVETILLTGEMVKGGLIRFELGNDELTEQAKKDLNAVFSILRGSPNKIMVMGHVTPTEGGGMYRRDVDLAFSRAVKVMDHLVSLGLKQEFFEIHMVDSTIVPHRSALPAGTDPALAGASVEIILLDQTLRSLNDNIRERATDTPIQ